MPSPSVHDLDYSATGGLLRTWNKDDLKKACANLETVLSDEKERGIDSNNLFNELQIFALVLIFSTSPSKG